MTSIIPLAVQLRKGFGTLRLNLIGTRPAQTQGPPARKELARELHYTGDMNDSAAMNIWLHKQVMLKLAQHGGKVPEELRS